ncbi:MAG: HDIG domain-containing protein [Candidatus Moraniibacteriota bacterium]|nr:MAG: HDIG domain-containing protein [Candidatus Moranbacteria bacterium]
MVEKPHILPPPVLEILATLEQAGFEAFVVGGSVRDILLGREPKDWDITTNAVPEEIQRLFPESFYENTFGTVGVKVTPFMPAGKENREEDVIEVTTYRAESGYNDKRHPSKISFVKTVEEDLARRDFTINAIALSAHGNLVDPFNGQGDLKQKIIRAVGNPIDRFGEDALRMLRAVRFSAELRTPMPLPKGSFMDQSDSSNDLHKHADWHIEPETFSAIQAHAGDIRLISAERISDELSKIILSRNPAEGIDLLRIAGLLEYIAPEITKGIGVGQNLHHIYSVYEHNIRALATCPSPRLDVRLAALLHDVGKPQTKRGNGYRSTFYNHDHVGARITRKLLERLRFPGKIIEKATLLVDNHLFYYNVGEVTAASVRRLIKRVGLENMRDLMDIRIADRLGSGTPKAKPYKLRHLEYMIEKVSKDPVSVKMLAINGRDLMKTLRLSPGPKIGAILDVLLAEVIEDPTSNTETALLRRAASLNKEDISRLRILAKDRIKEKRAKDDQNTKQKHWVQ